MTTLKQIGFVVIAGITMLLGLGAATANAEGFAAPGEVVSAQAASTSGVADSGIVSAPSAASVSETTDSGVMAASAAEITESLIAEPTVCSGKAWEQGPMPDGNTSAGSRALASSAACS